MKLVHHAYKYVIWKKGNQKEDMLFLKVSQI
jgi:hypothetical protein